MSTKILIIDDEEDLALMQKMFLSSKGYQVDIASNGKQGLEKISDDRPDVVLLDLIMPGMDGWEVCEILRKNEKYRDLPIIILTALSAKKLATNAREVGANELITKPCDEPELLKKIEYYVSQGKM